MNPNNHTSSGADSFRALAITPKSQPENPWLNGIPAVAQYTGCSRRYVQNLISDGELPVKRLSKRHLLIRRSDVDDLIDRLAREFEERQEAETAWCEEELS